MTYMILPSHLRGVPREREAGKWVVELGLNAYAWDAHAGSRPRCKKPSVEAASVALMDGCLVWPQVEGVGCFADHLWMLMTLQLLMIMN